MPPIDPTTGRFVRASHCKQGHEMAITRRVTPRGGSYCVECKRADKQDPLYYADWKRRVGYVFDSHKHALGRYGLTKDDYAHLLAAQNGVCAICNRPELPDSSTGRLRRLASDHDRESGEVRGLLCWHCNAKLDWSIRHAATIAHYLAGPRSGLRLKPEAVRHYLLKARR